ncbi:MAG: NAD(P)/FAD-dependent oxidoreductase [Pseudomonadota bacterium]
MHVLVVGAGPTGLTTALELARRDIEVTIVDRRDQASAFSRAVGILPPSLRIFEQSGVAERLLDEGMHYRKVNFHRGGSRIGSASLSGGDPDYDFILGLAQDRTEAILCDALGECGVSVDYNKSLTRLSQSPETVHATFGDGSATEFDYLVGADGIKSTVRDELGFDFAGLEVPDDWSIADVDAEGWHANDAFTVCRMSGGRVAVVAPLEPTRYRVIANRPDALSQLQIPMNVTNIRREATFKIEVRQVEQYRSGRVFLAGDAAHCHSPVGGRGMNLGIADGAALAQCLMDGDPDRYQAVRHPEGARTIELSERGRKFVTGPERINGIVFYAATKLVSLLPNMQKRLASFVLNG